MTHTHSFHRVVAIHQPNFFPWLGWFDKLCKADLFVILDDVEFKKSVGSWGNRVRIAINGKEHWLTMPVSRSFHGKRKYNEILLTEDKDWRSRMLRTLKFTYSKTPFWGSLFPQLVSLVNNPTENLVIFNMNIIIHLAELLHLDTSKFVFSSSLKINSAATMRLIDAVKAVGGDAYLCGGGAQGYQEDSAFSDQKIGLIYQNYIHPQYFQTGNQDSFISGLSVLDAMFNVGLEETRNFLNPLVTI